MIPGLAGIGGIAGPSSPGVVLTDRGVSDFGAAGAPASAAYSVASDGKVRNQDGTVLETWLPLGSSAASYQVRAVLSSGTAPGGDSLSTWLSLSSTRSWSQDLPGGADETIACTLTVSIRDAAAPNTVRATAAISITAHTTSGA